MRQKNANFSKKEDKKLSDGKKTIVGVFDSGVGGLSVLGACVRLAPQFSYLYYGDNARAPYGSRPAGEIVCFVREALQLFRERGAAAAVLACNTATAVAVERMRREFPFPVLGVEPAVKQAAARYGSALVLCTPRTAESERLRRLIARFPACRFTVVPLEGLAAEIERSLCEGKEPDLGAHLPPDRSACVVLGCTHYALVSDKIAAFYGVPVFDGAAGTARRLLSVLGGFGEAEGSLGGYINKSSPSFLGESGGEQVFFLGESAPLNEKIYKQMFKK